MRQATAALMAAGLLWPAQGVAEESLTTGEWQPPEATEELGWDLLRLPERLVQLTVAPVRPFVGLAEAYRVDRRLYDLFTIERLKAYWGPQIRAGTHDGLGAGIGVVHFDLLGGRETFWLSAVVRQNRDVTFGSHYAQPIASLDGRKVGLTARYKTDENKRYYGLGPDTRQSDERVIDKEELSTRAEIEVFGPSYALFNADLALVYRRTRIATGTDARIAGLVDDGTAGVEDDEPPLRPPPGFGDIVHLAEATLSMEVDTRDGRGATTRGALAEVEATLLCDLESADMRAVRVRGELHQYLPLLPRRRVLLLNAGTAIATPLTPGGEVPISGLVSLGKEEHLRGYADDRFLARKAWWASAEYRYPIFEFRESGITVSSSLFVDVARASGDFDDLFDGAPAVAGGIGLRVDDPLFSVVRMRIGFSREGTEWMMSVGDAP